MIHSARNRPLVRCLSIVAAFVGLAAPLFGWADPPIRFAPAVAVDDGLFGWAGEAAAARDLEALGDRVEAFGATDDEYRAVAERKVCLWVFTQAALEGRHLPTRRQQIGDCVSWGFGHAVEYSLAAHLTISGEGGRFVEVFKPYLYGCGRVFVGGGRLGGDGSTGAWQSRALEEYGVLPVDADGCPEYSGSLARQWGAPPGPPTRFVAIARKYRADCKLVTTWEDAAVSISSGAPVAVCSGYGFAIRERNGRIEGYRSGSWPHCMCFIAVDARRGFEALYCLNSWGENAHAPAARYAQLDGAPPGGFWVLKADVEGMLRSRDSYSVSFSGFVDRSERADELLGWLDRHQGESDARDRNRVDVGAGRRVDLGGDDVRPVLLRDADAPVDRPGTLRLDPPLAPAELRRRVHGLRLPGGLSTLAG